MKYLQINILIIAQSDFSLIFTPKIILFYTKDYTYTSDTMLLCKKEKTNANIMYKEIQYIRN